MPVLADRLLTSKRPDTVARAAVEIAPQAVERIEKALPEALQGDRRQTFAYVDAYRDLVQRVLDTLERSIEPALRASINQEAMSAPLSHWVGALGPGQGTAAAVVATLRTTLPGAEPLASPRPRGLPDWDLSEEQVVQFWRNVLDGLARNAAPLDRVASQLDLTNTELASLFGVRRQAVDQWRERGVPVERQEKLATLGAIADLLGAKVKRDRIPGIVRRSAPAYGDRTILEAIAAGEEEHVLGELRDAFDWAAAA